MRRRGLGVRGKYPKRSAGNTLLLVLTLSSVLASGATLAAQSANGATVKDPDPWIGLNRKIYGFNKFFDRWIMKPVAKTYDFVMPNPLQRGVSNVFDNVLTPWVAVNQFLQGKPKHGLSDMLRFGINSTVGVAGIFDVASHSGIRQHEEDFGQTLAVWGVPQGPYFVLPLRGPSTVTNAGGLFVDSYANPIRYIDHVPTRNTVIAVYFVDQRARLLDAEALISGDEYLFIRDAYLQRRAFLISDGEVEEDPFLDDDIDFDE